MTTNISCRTVSRNGALYLKLLRPGRCHTVPIVLCQQCDSKCNNGKIMVFIKAVTHIKQIFFSSFLLFFFLIQPMLSLWKAIYCILAECVFIVQYACLCASVSELLSLLWSNPSGSGPFSSSAWQSVYLPATGNAESPPSCFRALLSCSLPFSQFPSFVYHLCPNCILIFTHFTHPQTRTKWIY